MPGPLGTGSGGGAGTITSVTGGTGISVAGSGSLTVSNTGVTSLVAGSGVSLSSATGAVTLSATGGSTLGAIGVPTSDGMLIGIKTGVTSSYASSRMLGYYVATLGGAGWPSSVPMDYGPSGSFNSTDLLLLGRLTYLTAASNATLLEANLIPAYGSTYGTKKVGVGFIAGTKTQIQLQVSGLPVGTVPATDTNAVVVGYMGSGPRILIQDYDLATDEADSIRLVAKQVVFNGGMTVGKKAITAATTLDHSYHVVFCDGTTNYTVTLPDATRRDSLGNAQESGADAGRMYHIKKRSASTVTLTIATTSSQTIDGSTTLSITQQYTSLCLVSDGSNWNII